MMTRMKLLALISASAFFIALLGGCEQQTGDQPPQSEMEQQDPGMGQEPQDPGMGEDPTAAPPPEQQQ